MRSATILRSVFFAAALTLAALLAGCTVHPPGEREERKAAIAAGKRFEKPAEKRGQLPLPDAPTADDLVQHALLANGDLETRYWQWRSAIEQIPQDGTQSTTLNVALGSTITRGRTSSGMNSLTLGNDPMTDIKWPGKLDAAARIALQNARAAGLRFRKAQFELRGKVLAAYYDYALSAELIRLSESNRQLLDTTATITEARNRAGSAGQQDVLKARNEVDLANNDIQTMKAQLPSQRATLNALLDRPPDAPLPVPEALPPASSVGHDDAQLLALVAQRNPELSALAAEARGRSDAVQLARLQYFPDFNLSAGTDLAGITQNLLGQATLPLFRYEALNAAIAQTQANLRATDAMRRQTTNDLAAQVILDLATIRDADRQLVLFDQTILPRTRHMVDVARTSYESGHATLLDLLDSQRTLISVDRLVANLRTLRAKRLADLEAAAALNLELKE
jgi:cobalt-zinc-cadmium efflux system outer membrane protein